MNNEIELTDAVRSYKYKIEQTAKGARVTVHVDNLTEVIQEYGLLRSGLERAGFIVAPEDLQISKKEVIA